MAPDPDVSGSGTAPAPPGAEPEPDPRELDALERALVPTPPRFAHAHWLLRRGIGLSSLVAWLSLAAQEGSLFGPDGVFPMDERAARVVELSSTGEALRVAPSLFYFVEGSASGLGLMTMLGIIASLALAGGVWAGPAALVSYVAYLSFVSLGAPFLPLQWDTLLLESLVLCAALSPWTRLDSLASAREPPPLARYAAWLLPSRLLFASGLVKLLGGDPTWRDGTAMTFHYWTQPLPSPLAPLAHAMPAWFHAVETVAVLVLEIGLPLLVFFGARARAILAGGIAFLMALIALTGSYGFFNLLTVVLGIALVDDATLARFVPTRLTTALSSLPSPAPPSSPALGVHATRAMTGACGVLFVLGALELVTSIGLSPLVPDFVLTATDAVAPWRVTSSYGLFARMTTTRDELVFLATEDGEHWEEYDFRYKPGDPTRRPTWCTPHLPRFDWMLWFAALGDRADATWVGRVERGLMEGRPAIRALLRREPFDGRRPRAVRIERRSYELSADGTWVRGPPTSW